jgi:hypothetical protein
VFQKDTSGVGESACPADAQEKALTQLFFQRLDGLTNGWLGPEKLFGGLCKAFFFGHSPKSKQLFGADYHKN